MRHLLSILFLGFIFCAVPALSQDSHHCEMLKAESSRFGHPGELRSNAYTANYDLKYHRFNWYIDPAVNYISGEVTSHFVVTSGPMLSMQMDMSNVLQIDSIKYHGQLITWSQPDVDVLEFNFPIEIAETSLDSVSVYYQGQPDGGGLGSFIQTDHFGTPVIWTLSEPYGAKDWWPCKQDLVDKIDSLDMLVTCPVGNRAAGNGVLVAEWNDGVNATYHWRSHYPIAAYLVATAVTNYTAFDLAVTMEDGTEVPIVNYVYPESLSTAEAQLPAIVPVIELFDSLLIDYPFKQEKYGHCQFGWGGGMEHQTMSYVINFQYPLIAHECAHQWFGDRITCGSWEQIWLNEGFATYMEALVEENLYPAAWMPWKQNAINTITAQPDGSVRCDDTTNVDRIFSWRLTYEKGAYLLHMMRWQLGDSAFFASLRNYLNDPLLAYNYAYTDDLKHHFEEAYGQSLDVFFNQWYYGQGFPSYQVHYANEGSNVHLQLFQTTSHPSVSFYEMPVPIKLFGGGTDTTVVVFHQYSGQEFLIPMSFQVDSIQFDPELWILSANNTVELGIQVAEDAISRGRVYPNPASDLVNIDMYDNSPYDVVMYDATGRIVARQEKILTGRTSIDVKRLKAGIYYVQITRKQGGSGLYPIAVE